MDYTNVDMCPFVSSSEAWKSNAAALYPGVNISVTNENPSPKFSRTCLNDVFWNQMTKMDYTNADMFPFVSSSEAWKRNAAALYPGVNISITNENPFQKFSRTW